MSSRSRRRRASVTIGAAVLGRLAATLVLGQPSAFPPLAVSAPSPSLPGSASTPSPS